MIRGDIGVHPGASGYAVRSALRPLWHGLQRQVDRDGLLPLCWSPEAAGLRWLALPVASLAVAEHTPALQALLSGPRRRSPREIDALATALELPVARLPLALAEELAKEEPAQEDGGLGMAVEALFQYFSPRHEPAMALCLLRGTAAAERPLARMAELAALAQALAQARGSLQALGVELEPVVQPHGDGLLLWVDGAEPGASAALFQWLLLCVGASALSSGPRRDAALSAVFHIGPGCSGRWPGLAERSLVGPVLDTVQTMLSQALAGELLIGDFRARLPTSGREEAFLIDVDTASFVERACRPLVRPAALELAGYPLRALHGFIAGEGRRSAASGAPRPRCFNLRINLHIDGQPMSILGRR